MLARGNYKAPRRRLNAGYTLLELAIAMTLAGATLAGVVAFGAVLWAEQRASEFGQRMANIVTTVEDLYPGATPFTSLNLLSAVRLGVMRDENVVNAGGGAVDPVVRHMYGQGITLGGLAGAGFSGMAWGVHFAGPPGNSCMDIVQYALSLGDAVALVPDAAAASSFTDWQGIKQVNGGVTGFPANYQFKADAASADRVLKDRGSVSVTGGVLATACSSATAGGANGFGLAVVRTRL